MTTIKLTLDYIPRPLYDAGLTAGQAQRWLQQRAAGLIVDWLQDFDTECFGEPLEELPPSQREAARRRAAIRAAAEKKADDERAARLAAMTEEERTAYFDDAIRRLGSSMNG
jgi:hypothetical protein